MIKKVIKKDAVETSNPNNVCFKNNTQSLYQIFYQGLKKSINQLLEQTTLSNDDTRFYTKEGNSKKLRPFNKVFSVLIKEFLPETMKKELANLNLTKIRDTTLYGVYKQNYFSPIDISLLTEKDNDEKVAFLYANLLGANELTETIKGVYKNFGNFDKKQVKEMWEIFQFFFWDAVNKRPINIFENNAKLKDGVFYAINDGYIHITPDTIEFLDIDADIKTKTIFKIPINKADIKEWSTLSTDKNKGNYSIFKEFVLAKINNYDLFSYCIADLLQPLINTEIMYFMVGSGGSGKSTLQNYIINLLGESIVGNINLISALSNPFEREPLFNKMVVFSSELESSTLKDQAVLKQLVSRETTQLNLKHQAVKKARPIAKILIASNDIFKTTDTDGLNRRLAFISFNNEKIRDDLDILEFNKEINNDLVGFTALLMDGAQKLLDKKWNYETITNANDEALQTEFEGQYSRVNSLLSYLLKNKWLIPSKTENISISELASFIEILHLSKTTYANDDLSNILSDFNPRLETKKSLISRFKQSGLEKTQKRLRNRYDKKINIINVKNNRYLSNRQIRYQNTTIINGLKWNFNNNEFLKFLCFSTISGVMLDEIVPNFNTKRILLRGELKDIHYPLITLFDKDAPIVKTFNLNCYSDLNYEELNKLFNSKFETKYWEQGNDF